jgi:hypothetical protein
MSVITSRLSTLFILYFFFATFFFFTGLFEGVTTATLTWWLAWEVEVEVEAALESLVSSSSLFPVCKSIPATLYPPLVSARLYPTLVYPYRRLYIRFDACIRHPACIQRLYIRIDACCIGTRLYLLVSDASIRIDASIRHPACIRLYPTLLYPYRRFYPPPTCTVVENCLYLVPHLLSLTCLYLISDSLVKINKSAKRLLC